MESVKKTDDYEIFKKRSGRYGVRNAQQKWVGGDDKVKILVAEKLIKVTQAKKKAPEPAPEAEASEEAAPETDAGEAASPEAAASEGAEAAAEEPAAS